MTVLVAVTVVVFMYVSKGTRVLGVATWRGEGERATTGYVESIGRATCTDEAGGFEYGAKIDIGKCNNSQCGHSPAW